MRSGSAAGVPKGGTTTTGGKPRPNSRLPAIGEGEVNKTAALAFDRNQREFAQTTDSQALGEAAREALEGSEGPALM
jgi:hypothetical protein